MKTITFSPADAKWFVETELQLRWEEVLEKAPQNGPKLREMMTK
jgi:hypothetical protein